MKKYDELKKVADKDGYEVLAHYVLSMLNFSVRESSFLTLEERMERASDYLAAYNFILEERKRL